MNANTPTDEPLTVEDALKELREIFPTAFISVKHHAIYQPSWDIQGEPQADIQIDGKGFRRATLSDCMSQVRAWLKENQKQ